MANIPLKIKYGKDLKTANPPVDAGAIYLDTEKNKVYYDDPTGEKSDHTLIGPENIVIADITASNEKFAVETQMLNGLSADDFLKTASVGVAQGNETQFINMNSQGRLVTAVGDSSGFIVSDDEPQDHNKLWIDPNDNTIDGTQQVVQSINGKAGIVNLTAQDLGAMPVEELQQNINNALSQAKASGEFKGEKGDKGETGAIGPQGPAGKDGERGLQGPTGPANVRLSVNDTRSINSNPKYYLDNFGYNVISEFKYISTIGLDKLFSGTYCQVTTYTPWGDSSGGLPMQIATSNVNAGRVAIRGANSETDWNNWTLVPAINYNTSDISKNSSLASGSLYLVYEN